MIVGTGVDITQVSRVAEALERFGDRFLSRVFTPAEADYCCSKRNRAERLAARFAAKEAALKALGTGLRHGITWQDVEVRRAPGSRPMIVFSGAAAKHAARIGAMRASLSLSHTPEQAIAMVILESD
jgi:holo-[acyl-carrier protein] synthase